MQWRLMRPSAFLLQCLGTSRDSTEAISDTSCCLRHHRQGSSEILISNKVVRHDPCSIVHLQVEDVPSTMPQSGSRASQDGHDRPGTLGQQNKTGRLMKRLSLGGGLDAYE